MSTCIVITKELVEKIDGFLARGLSKGVGEREGQMCVEAAICAALDLPHGDDPGCVAGAVRAFKISLNDRQWSSPEARAKGLRNLAIAQLGSKGVVKNHEFVKLLAQKTIQRLLPMLIREISKGREDKYAEALRLAGVCETDGTRASALALRDEMYRVRRAAADAYAAAAYAAYAAAAYADAADAAAAAAYADDDDKRGAIRDRYLTLIADLALEVLRELKSPGVEWIS